MPRVPPTATDAPSVAFGPLLLFALKCSAGVGVLTFPKTVARTGYAWASCLIAASVLFMWWGARALLRAKRAVEEEGAPVFTYQDVARGVLGDFGERLAESAIMSFQFGVCAVYFDFLAAELEDVFPGALSETAWMVSRPRGRIAAAPRLTRGESAATGRLVEILRRRVAAAPRLPRGDSV